MKKKQGQHEDDLNFWQPASDMLSALLLVLMLVILLLGLYLVHIPEEDQPDPFPGDAYDDGGGELGTETPLPTPFIWVPDGWDGGGGDWTPIPTPSVTPTVTVSPTPDAGNGGGGFFATKVLIPLGADTTGSQFLEPDGMFPNHIPNPEDKKAMAAIQKAVVDNRADLGLIFDTDVDRMSAVLSDGQEVNRNALIAMMAAILAPDYPASTIVTDSVTSDGLQKFLESELHLKHHRFKRGYKNVINECIRLNKSGVVSPLAIETSGHGALSENYYLDDGAYLAVKLLIAAAKARNDGKNLASLIEKLEYPAEAVEYRLKIKTEDFKAYGEKVLTEFTARAKSEGIKFAEPNFEGVRLIFEEGWALLRLSLHDPNMPLNIESNVKGGCDKIASKVKALLKDFDSLEF